MKEEIEFKPMVEFTKGSHSVLCQYKAINSEQLQQTILPFRVKKASKDGEVYITTGRLEFSFLSTYEEMKK